MKRRRIHITYVALLVVARFAHAIDDPARLVVRPDSSAVASDSRISFFCRADGNPLPNVVWKINGKPLSNSRFIVKSLPTGLSTLRIDPVLASDNQTTVSCSADNGVANPVVADAVITVLDKADLPSGFPIVDAHPTLKSVEQGRTAHVTCRVRGDPRPKVLWLRDLVPIDIRAEGRYSVSTMGNPGALMIQQAREEDQGKYECVARNSFGVVHSKAAHLYVKVRRVPPYFSYKLEKIYRIGAGGSVNLTCVAVGFPMPRVFWKKSDDVVLSDPATAPIGKNVLTLTNVEQSENFTCVAVSKLGNIEATTLVEVKPLPPPPRHFQVSTVTSDTVTLTWERPVLTEPAVEYLIKYRQKYADSNGVKKWKVSQSETSTTIPDLEPFQLYEFVIATVGDFGEGPSSIPKEAQTAEAAPGSPPTKVQARSLNRDSVLVKWSPSEKPNGMITGYRIFYTNNDRSSPIASWEMHETKSDELMATLYGLEMDKRYYVVVQARNAQGSSPMSAVVTVATKPGTPGQPMSLAAKPLDSRRVQLSWEKPLFSLPVTGYVIWFNGTGGEKELTLTSPHEKHTVMGLHPNTSYGFKVAAISARGNGEFCELVFTTTPPSTLTGSPRLINVTATSSSVLHVSWLQPETTHQIVQYRIQYRIVNSENVTSAAITSSYEEDGDEDVPDTITPLIYSMLVNDSEATAANITSLQPFTIYEVTVAAATELGYGPESNPVRRQTLEDAGQTSKSGAALNQGKEMKDGEKVSTYEKERAELAKFGNVSPIRWAQEIEKVDSWRTQTSHGSYIK
ncbi:hypothetical protein RB195_018994 [Necator americanus]|uniref:Fibronectin type III domain protein n=1 Tax=Necator americanus TaxID=51031 RepID=A0ABR1CD98_NECAM